MNTPGLSVLLATLLAGFGAGVTLLISAASGDRRAMIVTLKAVLVWGVAYGVLLLTTSLSSNARLLGHGERKAFCGFYLDCHLGATVLHSDRVDKLFLGDSLVTTRGEFVLVDLVLDSDAKARTLYLDGVRAVTENAGGTRYVRRPDLEFEMNRQMGREATLEVGLAPGERARRILVFEVPAGTEGLRLHVSKGDSIERLLEAVLIGDEDSLLHGRLYHRL